MGFQNFSEKKPFKKEDGSKGSTLYYPGISIYIRICRDPLQKMLNFIFPSVVLSYFTLIANRVADIENVMATVSIGLLTYIAIIGQIRESLPPSKVITFVDWLIILYILYSLWPVINHAHFEKAVVGWVNNFIFFALNFVLLLITGIKYCLQMKGLNQKIP